jgi:hypothetical protein
MDITKILLLTVAAGILVSAFVDVPALFKKLWVKKPTVVPASTDVPKIHEIVEQWGKLKSMCVAYGSVQSSKELDNVFLSLLDTGKTDEKS